MTNFDDDTTSKIFAAVDKVKNEGINKDSDVYVYSDHLKHIFDNLTVEVYTNLLNKYLELTRRYELAIEYLTNIANIKDGQNHIKLDEHVRMTVQFYAIECLDKIQRGERDNNKT